MITTAEIIQKLIPIFHDVFDNDSIVISPETAAADVEDWDSLNNIQLIIAIEKAFKVKFKTAEIRSWQNVGEMCESIAASLNA